MESQASFNLIGHTVAVPVCCVLAPEGAMKNLWLWHHTLAMPSTAPGTDCLMHF